MAALNRPTSWIVLLIVMCSASLASSQQVHVTTPLVGVSDSFYEHFGVNWGFRTSGPNGSMFFDSGGMGGGIPPFGGYDPSADARFGFGSREPNGSAYFNLVAGQGSSRSLVSQSGSLTLMNGYPGYVQDISVRPFVTGLIPVVGDRRVSPLEEKVARLRQQMETNGSTNTAAESELALGGQKVERTPSVAATVNNSNSSAERGDISVTEIRRQQDAVRQQPDVELQELIDTARLAEARGFIGAARIRYQKAASRADGELRQQLLAKLESLRGR